MRVGDNSVSDELKQIGILFLEVKRWLYEHKIA